MKEQEVSERAVTSLKKLISSLTEKPDPEIQIHMFSNSELQPNRTCEILDYLMSSQHSNKDWGKMVDLPGISTDDSLVLKFDTL